jgi:hypothetical protein
MESPFETLPYELTTEILSNLTFPYLAVAFCVCRTWAALDSDYFYDTLFQKNELTIGSACLSRPRRWIFQSKFPVPEDMAVTFTGLGSSPFQEFGNYEGQWQDGQMHGIGTFYYKTSKGDYNVRYDGEWDKGTRQGKGKMFWGKDPPFDIYEGEFAENLFSGFGTFTWKTGDKYVGHWKENKRNGSGCFSWHAGDSYDGLWEDDLKSGVGTLKWHNGNQYHGTWVNELKENGSLYEAITKRTFDAEKIDYVINLNYVHPIILSALDNKACTSTVTGKNCYFQYLWQTTESSDRIHGVCYVCKETCALRNGYRLRNPNQFYFGGNFYCDCGTGRLGGECYAKEHHEEAMAITDEEESKALLLR